MDITDWIDRVGKIVEKHRIAPGQYARYLRQNPENTRKMGCNEYGCADAANILYSIGRFPRDLHEREEFIRTLQNMQNPQTGMYFEGTHHTIHTTAHCVASLELFDASPLYRPAQLLPLLESDQLDSFLEQLDWDSEPWSQAHQGAGLYAVMALTGEADPAWKKEYFDWLSAHNDPETGLGLRGRHSGSELYEQLNGWFHYLFNFWYAKVPFPHARNLIDTCIRLYRERMLTADFGREIGFKEIDWVFTLHRAVIQTGYRFNEAMELLNGFARYYVPWIVSLDAGQDDGLNDLHMLFGAVCAVSELQIALPGQIVTDIPLKNVLDRRPFI
jgi:hypothetical protein